MQLNCCTCDEGHLHSLHLVQFSGSPFKLHTDFETLTNLGNQVFQEEQYSGNAIMELAAKYIKIFQDIGIIFL